MTETEGKQGSDRWVFAPNGLPARLALAVLGSVGILYANFSPVIVSGLTQSPYFTAETAAYVFAANMYGTAIGGLAAVFLVGSLNWRWSSLVLVVLLSVADVVSALVGATESLYVVRFVHGLIGGSLMGIAMSVIARMESPERTIAFAIVIQLSLGGLGAVVLIPQLSTYGIGVVWLSLIGLSVCALVLLPFLGQYPRKQNIVGSLGVAHRPSWGHVFLAMAALFLFQSGQMAAFAYRVELGLHYGLSASFISLVLAVSLWLGAPAALFVAWWSTRSGRWGPVCLGGVCMTVATALLLLSNPIAFFGASIGFAVFFAITIPYLLGVASEMDNTGQMAAMGGFVNSLGLATGPAIAGILLGDAEHYRVLLFASAVLAASVVTVFAPARMLDSRAKHSRVIW